jgi:hypothetical protein
LGGQGNIPGYEWNIEGSAGASPRRSIIPGAWRFTHFGSEHVFRKRPLCAQPRRSNT